MNQIGKIVFKVDQNLTVSGSFSDGLVLIRARNKDTCNVGCINNTGALIIEPFYCQASSFSEGLASVQFPEGDKKSGFIDTHGNVVIKPLFDEAASYSEGFASIQLGGKWGFVDKSENIPITPRYDWVGEICHPPHRCMRGFLHGLAEAGLDGGHVFIDTTGTVVYKFED